MMETSALNSAEAKGRVVGKLSSRNQNAQKCPECGKMTLRRVVEDGSVLNTNWGEIQEVNVYFECPCGYGESAQ